MRCKTFQMESFKLKVKPSLKAEDLLPNPGSKRGPSALCLVCFERWDPEMSRHVSTCKGKDASLSEDELKKLGAANKDAFNAAVQKMRGSIFFSMRELRATKLDTTYQIAEYLRSMGHCAVPEEFEDVYYRVPVYNTLSDRNFVREVEDEEHERQEREFRLHESRPIQERRAAITLEESVSPSQEPEADTNDFGDAGIEPNLADFDSSPAVFRQPQIRGRKRSVVASDDEVPGPSDTTDCSISRDTLDKSNRVVPFMGLSSMSRASGKGKRPLHGPSKAKRSKTTRADVLESESLCRLV